MRSDLFAPKEEFNGYNDFEKGVIDEIQKIYKYPMFKYMRFDGLRDHEKMYLYKAFKNKITIRKAAEMIIDNRLDGSKTIVYESIIREKGHLVIEGIEDLLKPLSKEDINSEMEKLSPASLLEKGLKLEDKYLIQTALDRGAKISNGKQLYTIEKLFGSVSEFEKYISDPFKLQLGITVKKATPDQLFSAAVKNEDSEKIKMSLAKGAKNVDFLNSHAMMIAIQKNDVELVKMLLKKGINPTKK